MPLPLLVGPRHQQRRGRVVDADEGQHQPRRVLRRQLLIQHHLLGDGHAAAPFGGPVRHGVAAECRVANQSFWNATNSASVTDAWRWRQSVGTLAAHQS